MCHCHQRRGHTHTDTNTNTNSDVFSNAKRHGYSNVNANCNCYCYCYCYCYWYSLTYTDSNRQAVPDAEIGAHPKAATNSPAETLGFCCLWLFEIALVLVRLDHVASTIVNANHGVM